MFVTYGLAPGLEPPIELAVAMVHPDDRAASAERIARALETGQGWTDSLTRIVRPDGEVRYLESRGVSERDGTGAISSILGAAVDVTDRKRAERAAAEADAERRANIELFENAFDHATIGMALVAQDGRFLKVNPAFCDLIGYPEGQMLGLDFQAITHPDDLEADLEFLAQLTAGEIPSYQMDKRYVRADGVVVWVHLSVSMTAEAPGRPAHYISQVQDLTARKETESALAQSEQRFRRLADNAPDIITESLPDGTLTYVSPASLTITGFSPDELIGRQSISLMHPEDAPAVLQMCRAVLASRGALQPWSVEFRAQHKSGRELWLECKPTPAFDRVSGEFTGLNDVVRDITSRKVLEAELRQARANAEAASALKGEFLANMSHELRTPLTSIVGFTGLAAGQPELGDLSRTYIDRVAEASRALLCTVNDILDFSKLEAGQVTFEPEPTALKELGRATLDLFTPQAGAKHLDLTLDHDPGSADLLISVDPDRIRQILLNLVGNAVKFTETGGVTLRIRYDRDAERLGVEVIDTGVGIAPDKIHGLFKRFSQIDGSLTRTQGGTGLGLAICKGLVEAMGGSIGVDSGAGAGSRFWFDLPAPLAAAVTPQAGMGDAFHPDRLVFDGMRVLVVDDHPANRELARLFLAGVGAEVTQACDGEEAIGLAAAGPFDVILMDMRMPRLDGPTVLRRIRQAAGPNDATPILAFTADADTVTTCNLTEMGFQDVVGKPLDPTALFAALARATAMAQPRPPASQREAG